MRRNDRCPHDGKVTFRSHRIATRHAARLPEPGRVYWCVQGGGYHLTRLDAAEYDQRRGEGIREAS